MSTELCPSQTTIDVAPIHAVYNCAEVQTTLSLDLPLASGDINGDGLEDIVGIRDKEFVTYIFTGSGYSEIGERLGKNVLSATLKDLDGDEKLDALIGQQKNILIALNDGTSFTSTLTISTQHKVQDISSLDIDNDGDNDIVSTGGSIIIYLNDLQGSGQFLFSQELPCFTNASSLLTADVNNDGESDIIAGSKCFLGNGDGTFTDTNQTIGKKQAVKVLGGDFDGDEDIDIATLATGCSGSKGSCMQIFTNDGQGFFTESNVYSLQSKPTSALVGDFENDGDLDIFVGTKKNQGNYFFYNDGAGNFMESAEKSNALMKSPDSDGAEGSLTFDLGFGDGDLDLIYGAPGDDTSIVISDRATIHRNNKPLPPDAFESTLEKGEILLTWNEGVDDESRTLNYFLRVGTEHGSDDIVEAEIGPVNRTKTSFGNAWYAHEKKLPALSDGVYYWAVSACDDNFERSPWSDEQAFEISSGKMTVLPSPKQPALSPDKRARSALTKDGGIVSATTAWYSTCPPPPFFSEPIQIDFFTDSSPGYFVIGELDNDPGTLYDFVLYYDGVLFTYMNNGDTTFNRTMLDIITVPTVNRYYMPYLALFDVNRDASTSYALDLIANRHQWLGYGPPPPPQTHSHYIDIIYDTDFADPQINSVVGGKGTFLPGGCVPDIGCSETSFMFPVEVSFNGFYQLLVATNRNTELSPTDNPGIMLTDENFSTLYPASIFDWPFSETTKDMLNRDILYPQEYSVSDAVVHDFNNDGHQDLFIGYDSDGIGLYARDLSLTEGFYTRVPDNTSSTLTAALIPGDFDGDGDMDVARLPWSYDGYEPALLYLNQNDIQNNSLSLSFTENPIEIYSVWNGYPLKQHLRPSVGDFNLDGKPDLLIYNQSTNALVLYQNIGPPDYFGPTGFSIPGSHHGLFFDYDKDGDLDILCVNSATGTSIELYENTTLLSNDVPQSPYQITITRDHGYVYFSWERGYDRETPIESLTYNLTIFDAGSWQILYGPNLGPEHITPGYGNVGMATSIQFPAVMFDALKEYHVAIQSVDNTFNRSEPYVLMPAFTINNLTPAAPIIDPVISPTNQLSQTISGRAMPDTTVKIVNGDKVLFGPVDSTGNFLIEDVPLNINSINEISVTIINDIDPQNPKESGPAVARILQDSLPPGYLNSENILILGIIPGPDERAKSYIVDGMPGAITDFYPHLTGSCGASGPSEPGQLRSIPDSPCSLPDDEDCYYFELFWKVYDGTLKIAEGSTPVCSDGSFSFSLSIGMVDPAGITFVLHPHDIAGNQGMYPGSYNLQMEDIWREAEYLWLGKFNGTHQMVDCGCPDCSYPCGTAPDGTEDCVVCDDYSITIAAADSPFFMLEFEDGFGLISGTSNPNISFSGSIDLGINYDTCHRDETTVTPYTFMTLRQNAATCFPEPNNCYPFGGFFTFADEDIIEATIMSVPGELDVELTEYEYDDFIGHSYTFPNLTASPILGLYEFGWYGFFTMGPRFTIPDVFTDEETRRRELSLTPADYKLGTCDPPEKNDEEYRYSNLSLQAAAIRIEPPLRFLQYYEDEPERYAQEFTVIIDFPVDKYIIDLEIVTEDGGGQAYFQESGTTLLEDVHDNDTFQLVITHISSNMDDTKIIATIREATTGKNKYIPERNAILDRATFLQVRIGDLERVHPNTNPRSLKATPDPEIYIEIFPEFSVTVSLEIKADPNTSGSATPTPENLIVSGNVTVSGGLEQSWNTQNNEAAPDNMRLIATIDDIVFAEERFTVAAIPVDFEVIGHTSPYPFVLLAEYRWASDSGYSDHLDKVWVGEWVEYLDGGGHNIPPWADWNQSPFILPPRNTRNGHWVYAEDAHTPPGSYPDIGYIAVPAPGPEDSFCASQYYGYRDFRTNPGDENDTTLEWQTDLAPMASITRVVYYDAALGWWVYKITKLDIDGVSYVASWPITVKNSKGDK